MASHEQQPQSKVKHGEVASSAATVLEEHEHGFCSSTCKAFHPPVKRQFQCKFCGLQYTYRKSLLTHEAKCDAKFKNILPSEKHDFCFN
jgi:hypothetical protein